MGSTWTEVSGGEFAYNDFPRYLTEHQDMFYMGGLYYDLEAEIAQTGMVFHSEDGSTWATRHYAGDSRSGVRERLDPDRVWIARSRMGRMVRRSGHGWCR